MENELWLAFLSTILHDAVSRPESESPPLGGEQNPNPLVLAGKDERGEDATTETVEELSEAEPVEKPAEKKPSRRKRLKAAGKYLLHVALAALDRAVVLVIALTIIGVSKWGGHCCGLPVK